jgi:hypothetical protein
VEQLERQAERRQSWRRMRWRMRGAWQWPAFCVLTLADAVLLGVLPFYGDGPDGIVPALLLAAFFNIVAVAVLAPLGGRLLRRRRPDLPRMVAANYAGTALVVAVFAAMLVGGIVHRPAADAAVRDRASVLGSVRAFVVTQRPELRSHLAATDVMRVEERLYRACVPQRRPSRWLCFFVSTDQSPPGITRDHDEHSNETYRSAGGFG